MNQVDIRALANLARLAVSDEEVARLEKEIPAILTFVEEIQHVATNVAPESPEHRNVLRDDSNPHEGGRYTNDLLAAAPLVRDNQVAVKQVISKKK